MVIWTFDRDDIIIQENKSTEDACFYILLEGKVSIRHTVAKHTKIEITQLGPHGHDPYFGEMALINPKHKTTADVVAISSHTKCLVLTQQKFLMFIARSESDAHHVFRHRAMRAQLLKAYRRRSCF